MVPSTRNRLRKGKYVSHLKDSELKTKLASVYVRIQPKPIFDNKKKTILWQQTQKN
jgi:hypothetical protein